MSPFSEKIMAAGQNTRGRGGRRGRKEGGKNRKRGGEERKRREVGLGWRERRKKARR